MDRRHLYPGAATDVGDAPAPFASADDAMAVLANPGDPAWGAAFAFLAGRPETASLMLEVFAETLEQLGIEPSGTEPGTGLAVYRLEDVAAAMGLTNDTFTHGADEHRADG